MRHPTLLTLGGSSRISSESFSATVTVRVTSLPRPTLIAKMSAGSSVRRTTPSVPRSNACRTVETDRNTTFVKADISQLTPPDHFGRVVKQMLHPSRESCGLDREKFRDAKATKDILDGALWMKQHGSISLLTRRLPRDGSIKADRGPELVCSKEGLPELGKSRLAVIK